MESQAEKLWQQQFEKRAELSAVVQAKNFSARATKFLHLAVDAAFEHAQPGVRCVWRQESLWLQCEQKRLGELLECTDRTVRKLLMSELCAVRVEGRDPEDFERAVLDNPNAFLFILRSVPESDGPPREHTVYFLEPSRLAAFQPPDLTDPIDAAMHCFGGNPLWQQERESKLKKPVEVVPSESVSPISGASSGGSSGGASALSCPAPVSVSPAPPFQKVLSPVLRAQEEQEGGKNLDFESQEARSFNAIAPDEVRLIGGYRVNGSMWHPKQRLRVVSAYFADAMEAGFATEAHFGKFVALFRMTGRRMKSKDNPVGDPNDFIRACWANYTKNGKALKLIPADSEYARDDILSLIAEATQ